MRFSVKFGVTDLQKAVFSTGIIFVLALISLRAEPTSEEKKDPP